jgi:hypothetical protein
MRQVLLTRLLSLSFGVISLNSSLNAGTQLLDHWEEKPLGGDTACADGSPFSFFISPGNPDKVIIDFGGGGVCWNEDLCEKGSPYYLDSMDKVREVYQKKMNGIYIRDHMDNPLAQWTHIMIPYCTGDLHWGHNDVVYKKESGKTFTIKHRGAVNAKAVFEWVKEHYPTPRQILAMGYSAGAYGAEYHLPRIERMFPSSQITQFGDSGISPITTDFAKLAFPRWNIEAEGPTWVPGLEPDKVQWTDLQIGYLIETIDAYFVQKKVKIRHAHFTTAFDGTQRFLYALMDGDIYQWSPIVQTTLRTVAQNAQFNYFVGPGIHHGIVAYESFYNSKSTNGIKFSDWFRDYVQGKDVVNVDCDGCQEENTELTPSDLF